MTAALASSLIIGPATALLPAAAVSVDAPAVATGSDSAAAPASGSASEAGGSPASDPDNGRGPVPVYEVVGTEVSGGSDLSSAADVEPGVYRDVLDQGGSDVGTTRFYQLPALKEGESVHAAAVLALDSQKDVDSDGSAQLGLEFVNPHGDSCGTMDTSRASPGSTTLPLVAAGRSDVMEAGSYGCFEDESGRVIVKVTREGQWQADEQVPLELRFWIEPPVDEDQLSEASEDDAPPESVTASGDATPLEAGSSFATATEIEPDQVYSLEIRPYQVQYFRVPVEYGQRLSYRLSTGNNEDASVQGVSSAAYNPLFNAPRMLNSGASSLRYSDVGAVATGNIAVPVSQNEYGSFQFSELRIGGDYYITVSASEPRSNREGSQPFRYELAAAVTGDASGTTEWVSQAHDQQADGVEDEGAEAQASGASGAGGWFPTGTELGALLGGVGLGAVLIAVVWLLLRRRNRSV
ncbi:hypothetical protein [Citricoccus sp. GCM10030269]|uniref:hypothetical protein n=1 Tax=Citricoccus sp. GCM10030269 TaxID=3273388 RepID=UPI0036243211